MQTFEKLKAIRKAEGLTQAKFSEISGIALGTVKNYESGHKDPGLSIVMRVTNTPLFKKYTLWLMTGDTSPQAGQIAPALTHWAKTNRIRPLRETDWLTLYKHYIFTICYQDGEYSVRGLSYVN